MLLKSTRILKILRQKVSFSTYFKIPSKASLMAIQETLVSFGRFFPPVNQNPIKVCIVGKRGESLLVDK